MMNMRSKKDRMRSRDKQGIKDMCYKSLSPWTRKIQGVPPTIPPPDEAIIATVPYGKIKKKVWTICYVAMLVFYLSYRNWGEKKKKEDGKKNKENITNQNNNTMTTLLYTMDKLGHILNCNKWIAVYFISHLWFTR